nr:MAG TPA: hypothetical protein [Caudoviricetes sp.]
MRNPPKAELLTASPRGELCLEEREAVRGERPPFCYAILLNHAEFGFQTFLQNTGKIDVCGFGCIVKPTGNGKRLFDRFKLLLIFFHIKRNHRNEISVIHMNGRRKRGFGTYFTIFEH